MRGLKSIMVFIVVMLLMLSMTTVAFAEGTTDKKVVVEDFIVSTCKVQDNVIKYTNGAVKAYVREKADSTYNSPVTLSDGQTMLYYNQSSINMLYKQAVKVLENDKVNQKVSDISNNMAIQANTEAAGIMLSGFKPILELLIGIIVILITFGMTIFSSLDICYIALTSV